MRKAGREPLVDQLVLQRTGIVLDAEIEKLPIVPGFQQIAEPLVLLDAPAFGKGIAEDNCAMRIAADRAFAVACAEEVGTQRDRETSTFLPTGIVGPVPGAPRLSLRQPAPTPRRPQHQVSRFPVDARYVTEKQQRTDLAGNYHRQQ